MITRNQVCTAIKTLRGEVHADPTGLFRQLALSLKVYWDRGEWDGTVDSACECLVQSAYLIDCDAFYIKEAQDFYGEAIRDNSRAELVEIGKTLYREEVTYDEVPF